MVKKNVFFVPIGSTIIPSSGQLHISRYHLDKGFNLELPKLLLYQLTKIIDAEITPHISSSLKDLGAIFENLFYLVVPNWQIQTLKVI